MSLPSIDGGKGVLYHLVVVFEGPVAILSDVPEQVGAQMVIHDGLTQCAALGRFGTLRLQFVVSECA